jgi:hypothetical protein
MKESKIVFINRSNSKQKIVVEDHESAQALELAMKQYHDNQWARSAEVIAAEVPREFISSRELRVIVVCGRSTFRSISSKISTSSVLLKSKLPQNFMGFQCTAFIHNAALNEQIELGCTLSLHENGSTVIDFNQFKGKWIKQLEAWI